jgi:DnaJ-class molecular chaperone
MTKIFVVMEFYQNVDNEGYDETRERAAFTTTELAQEYIDKYYAKSTCSRCNGSKTIKFRDKDCECPRCEGTGITTEDDPFIVGLPLNPEEKVW